MAARPMPVALVLHAHLPHVVGGGPWCPTERWLHEAIWECYLPLVAMLDGLAADDVGGSLTVSVSPPLASMLADPTLGERFARYLGALTELNDEQRRSGRRRHFSAAWELYRQRLGWTRTAWRERDGDLLGGLARHRRRGRIELWTTTASHAYLPGLRAVPGAAAAQLRIGQASFAALTAIDAQSLWLPECGFDDTVDEALATVGCPYTILDEHALRFADPRPAAGAALQTRAGVVVLPRNRAMTHLVWDARHGYPGHPCYREFHHDLGLELGASELGPFGPGTPTGLKAYRITARDGRDKAPYDPRAAQTQVQRDATDFVTRLEAVARSGAPFVVAAFDAELFGHWWFEGPEFLAQVLGGLHRSPTLTAATVGATVAAAATTRAQPTGSSWGRGGFGGVWVGPRTAWLWRHVHHAHATVQGALRGDESLSAERAAARDEAIRELLLLEASDWAFLIDGDGDGAALARRRVARHHGRAMALAAIAAGRRQPDPTERQQLTAPANPSSFLHELSGPALWAAFC